MQLLVDGDAKDSRKSGGYSLKPGALDRASAGFFLRVALLDAVEMHSSAP